MVARLATPAARAARDTLAARRYLARLAHGTPRRKVRIRVGRPRPAGILLRYYRKAERRFHVAWEVLAAVNFVESAFGRVKSASVSGAQGPMQFMPATWRAYGMGGNVHDAHDAILGAANYLHASGAPRDYRRALYAYNHSTLYVNAVLRYTRRMARDRRAYYAYYSWQVFVRTPTGERRVTGPGLR
ncbi:MAG: lytic transglycosylase domain-containing protein [Actinomycetota bacterium]|nr:lytic transglycosylase domain-containing protein [Actinomycetota bacterium]